MNKLENFVSKNGARHYNLKSNKEKIKFIKLRERLIFKKYLNINKEKVKIFEPDFSIYWKIAV